MRTCCATTRRVEVRSRRTSSSGCPRRRISDSLWRVRKLGVSLESKEVGLVHRVVDGVEVLGHVQVVDQVV
eukprot:7676687-Heterocapsa_arctica.AAC.1